MIDKTEIKIAQDFIAKAIEYAQGQGEKRPGRPPKEEPKQMSLPGLALAIVLKKFQDDGKPIIQSQITAVARTHPACRGCINDSMVSNLKRASNVNVLTLQDVLLALHHIDSKAIDYYFEALKILIRSYSFLKEVEGSDRDPEPLQQEEVNSILSKEITPIQKIEALFPLYQWLYPVGAKLDKNRLTEFANLAKIKPDRVLELAKGYEFEDRSEQKRFKNTVQALEKILI